ncbi:hypothetical protein HA402_004421 [Bradysia odoriphaga]|nr:hypothetical protein HA402_004421 [Bradysia odoriphaga]
MVTATTFVLVCLFPFISPSNILVVSPALSMSHFKVGEAIATGLANAGHNVTLISPYDYKPKIRNIEPVQIAGLAEQAKSRAKLRVPVYIKRRKNNSTSSLDSYHKMPVAVLLPIILYLGADLCNLTLSHANVKALYGRKFDLIVLEMFSTEALIGLGQQFNAPVIAYSALATSRWTNDLIGNESPTSYIPHPFLDLPVKFNLWHRVCNYLFYVYESILFAVLHHPLQRSIYDAAFPDAKLSYDEARKNVSLIFVNSHFSLARPLPYVPNTIEVGGLHINRFPDPLPQNIKEFIESAEDGVFLFSMGSILNSAAFPIEKRDMFINAFANIKQKIIWKFEDETVQMPKNVLTSSWLPQTDILSHPNVKAFISHGGLLGTAEAVYHGVPMIAIPLSGDTRLNVERASEDGWVIRLDYANITMESVEWAVREIADNEKYFTNAKIMSQRYRDQPMTPNELMVYWSEYIIRHRGAPHLRSTGLDLNYVQYHNIDVLLVLISFISVAVYALRWIVSKTCWRRKSMKQKQSDEKKWQ